MRRLFVILLTFLGGAFFLFEFLLPAGLNPLSQYLELATDLVIVLGTMAFLLGPINLTRTHFAALVQRRPGWLGSAVFLVFLFGSVFIALGKDAVLGDWAKNAWGAGTAQAWSVGLTRAYDVLFYGVNFGFGTTSMALLTFYLVSAAYRSFRLNGVDSAIMFVAATVVLLGRTPLGDWLTSGLPESFRLSSLENWIMTTPNAAVQRAVVIGTFAGAFAAALRYWLSIGVRRTE